MAATPRDEEDGLVAKIYSVRKGWRPGHYSLDKLIPAIQGHPSVEFECFDNIDKADEYLCSYLEVARSLIPYDISTVYVSVNTVQAPAGGMISGIGIFAHPIDRSLNLCLALGQKESVPRELGELIAMNIAFERIAATIARCITHETKVGEVTQIVANLPMLLEVVESKIFAEYQKLDEKEMEANGGFTGTQLQAYGYEQWVDEVNNYCKLRKQHSAVKVVSAAGKTGNYALRMSIYMSKKASTIATHLTKS